MTAVCCRCGQPADLAVLAPNVGRAEGDLRPGPGTTIPPGKPR